MATVPVKGSDNLTYQVEVNDDSPDGLIQVVAVDNFPATQPVSGTVAVSNQPADPATQTTLAAILAKLIAAPASEATLASVLAALASVPVTGPLTNTQLRATAVPVDASGVAVPVTDNGGSLTVDGTVAVTNANLDIALSALRDALRGASSKTLSDVVTALASVPVTGTFWQATQPVSFAQEPVYTTVAVGELIGVVAATQLPNVACRLVRFKASAANTGKVYLGGSGVTKVDGSTDTTTGLQLQAGDDTGWIPVDNLNRFYRISDATTDTLTYLALSA